MKEKKSRKIIVDRDTYEMMRKLHLLSYEDEVDIIEPITRPEFERISLEKQLERIKNDRRKRETNKD
jgi:hypothetical protein